MEQASYISESLSGWNINCTKGKDCTALCRSECQALVRVCEIKDTITV